MTKDNKQKLQFALDDARKRLIGAGMYGRDEPIEEALALLPLLEAVAVPELTKEMLDAGYDAQGEAGHESCELIWKAMSNACVLPTIQSVRDAALREAAHVAKTYTSYMTEERIRALIGTPHTGEQK